MTRNEIDYAVACATGESLSTIRRRGFSLVEPTWPAPLVMDWEEYDENRPGIFPAQVPRDTNVVSRR